MSNPKSRLLTVATRAVASTDGLLLAYAYPKPFSRSRLARIGHRVALVGAAGDVAGLTSAFVSQSHHLSRLATASFEVAAAAIAISLTGLVVMNVGLFTDLAKHVREPIGK
jgi:hypothetical protein